MSVKGLDSFFDVVEVLKDPKKFEAKAKELKEMTRQYQEVVEAVVELSKVNEYTVSIREREEQTKKLLEEAKQNANKVVADAKGKADGILDEARKTKTKAEELVREFQGKAAELDKQREELSIKAHRLAVAEEALNKKDADLLAKQVEIDERLAKLKSVMV